MLETHKVRSGIIQNDFRHYRLGRVFVSVSRKLRGRGVGRFDGEEGAGPPGGDEVAVRRVGYSRQVRRVGAVA